MAYLRYYLGNAFVLLGLAGFVLGERWVWLGAATFPLLVLIDLPFQQPDLAEREIRHPWLADVPLYLHFGLLVALLVSATWRIRLISKSEVPSASQLAGCVISVGWLVTLPNLPVMHELFHRRGRLQQLMA